MDINDGFFSGITHQNLEQDFKLLKAALDASVTGIIITDNGLPDNPIIYCNKAFEDMTGYQRSEIIGRNCRFLQKDDREQAARYQLGEAVANGNDAVVEIRNYKKDGTLFWNELYLSPTYNDNGQLTYFVGVQHDITLRKRAEEELKANQAEMEQRVEDRTRSLREKEEYLSSIFETIRESLMVLSPELKVLTVNHDFIKTFKVSKEETEGKQLYELGNGQWDIPELRRLLEQVLPTNNPVVDFEVSHDFPHIGKKLMLLNAHRIELEGEYKDRILIAIEDITDKREIEQRKDDFLSIASHELKTPLTTVKGYVQVMDKLVAKTGDEKLHNAIDKTSVYIDRLNNLITELLDVSRIQSGKFKIYKEPFSFDNMVQNAVNSLHQASPSHHINVIGETGIEIVGDEAHLEQVMINLLSNAIKYSPDEKEVDVQLSVVSNFVKVSVSDKGLGISREEQKRIFDRFYRVGNIQQKFPGMGIGLYICSEIIKNHGGNLWVESEPGKGSSFSFTLPLTKSDLEEDAK
ncbi:PAS domain S-box protein [Mucilaginibacter sp. 21P]|uniref:PAS domain-containing sensor histidine kinase n=1 Tax=Mucilaginibacter sp. 21P TaxID=2778902 RepID=UPI002107582E|nr:PAS domain S-box protein [Mucilaginibacter sp. 21P]